MGLIGIILAVLALSCSVYLWLELQKKLSPQDIGSKLSQSCDELSKTYEKQLREIETEWAEMYQKFQRMLGRADKLRGLEAPAPAAGDPALPSSRSDLLRKHRGR